MKFYALISKWPCEQGFRASLLVSDEIQGPQMRGQGCVEITIAQPDTFFQPYEVPVTDRYDRLFSLPADLLNEGTVRLVAEKEIIALEKETKHRVPLP